MAYSMKLNLRNPSLHLTTYSLAFYSRMLYFSLSVLHPIHLTTCTYSLAFYSRMLYFSLSVLHPMSQQVPSVRNLFTLPCISMFTKHCKHKCVDLQYTKQTSITHTNHVCYLLSTSYCALALCLPSVTTKLQLYKQYYNLPYMDNCVQQWV